MPADDEPSGLLRRLLQAFDDELGGFHPRKFAAEALSRHLPALAFVRTRTAALRLAGVRIGARSLVLGEVRLTGVADPCSLLSIGAETIVTCPLHADLGAPIVIGDRVRLGPDVSLLTISHETDNAGLRAGKVVVAPIEIGDGCWIASRAVVLPGVKIGAGAIVGAGAVVHRDVPPNTLVAGVPARVIRELPVE